jgi:hypothetical protein
MRRSGRKFSLLLGSAAALLSCGPRPAAGAAGDYGRVVELPPFIAEDSAVPLRWRYARFDQFEILSLCADSTTTAYAQKLYVFSQELSSVLPPSFLFRTSVPITYLLCDERQRKRLDQDIPVETYLGHVVPPGQESALSSQPHFVEVPNLRLQDDDACFIFTLPNRDLLEQGPVVYLPGYVEFLLRKRTPPLPAWFIRGFVTLYDTMTFEEPFSRRDGAIGIRPRLGEPPFVWISDNESRLLRQKIQEKLKLEASIAHTLGPGASAEDTGLLSPLLLPMEDILVSPHPPPGPAEAIDRYQRAWNCQAALFVQWALDNANPAAREGFLRFLTQASAEPPTEAMFRDCLGVDFKGMGERLGRYFIQVSPSFDPAPVRLGIDAPSPPFIPVRDATASEVARIKGDWERLEAAFVSKAYPGLGGAYLEHAHHTLWHGYDQGDRDPRLLAAMGLYECDAGNDAAARPLLAAAVRAHVVRPRAYFELARILYAEELAKPAGAKGTLSAGQIASVFGPLADGWTQSPPLLAAGELVAEVWFHSEVAPTRADLAELDRESLLFPQSTRLISQIAVLDARAGLLPEANRLIDRGLANAPDEASRARLLRLRAALATPK